MSLLKLLFDLPEAGGESNFSMEEQEELMAFEQNLNEHNLEENFAVPVATVDQLGGFLPGAASLDPAAAANGAPVLNGVPPPPLMEIVSSLENGHIFGSSNSGEQVLAPPLNQEPAPPENNAVSLEPVDTAAVVPVAESTPVTASLQPAVGAAEAGAPSKKYDISTKHQGSGKAVWVKWRGKWQAAIQVRVEDCRAATVKAMPTYGKKEWVPIYVVTNRSYIWIDAQNICDIKQKPEPLLSGTHDDWLRLVIDTGAPRRRTFLSLGWEMLDISDRLHILGVIERARDVSVWKEFSKEASEALKYSELGTLLVRIHAVVEPVYVRQSWVEKRLNAWTQECMKAETAATIEKLTKECIRVILWDDAAKLWEAPEQPGLDPSWTEWKGPAFDELTEPDSGVLIPSDKPSRPSSSSSVTPKVEKEGHSGSKRGRKPKEPKSKELKEGSDRSPALVSGGRVTTRTQGKVEKHHDAGPSSSAATERFPVASEPVVQTLDFSSMDPTKLDSAIERTPETEAVAPKVQPKGQGSGEKLSRDGPLNSASKTWKWKFKSDAWGCSAFLKTKKRRCPRQACRGIYCEKHQGLAENPSADPNVEPSNLCMARYWVENRRCANAIVEGSYYCVMHADCRPPKSEDAGPLNDTKDQSKEGKVKVAKEKHLRSTGVTAQDAQLREMMKDDPNHFPKQAEQNLDQLRDVMLATSGNEDGAAMKVEQHDLQSSSQPSERHQRGGASHANGGGRANGPLRDLIKDKNLGRLVADLNAKERKGFLKAQDMLCKYMNQGLSESKGGTEEAQSIKIVESIMNETSKDYSSGEMLLKILTAEKDRLAKVVLEGATSRKGVNMVGIYSGGATKSVTETLSSDNSVQKSQTEVSEAGPDTRNMCCLCGRKFEQLSLLGNHWKEHHKQEAQLFEKCLRCRICDKDAPMFRKKLDVLNHYRAEHPTLPMSSPSWSVCVMCDKECSDFDHLWQHVEDQHHSLWSSADFAGRIEAILMLLKGHKCSLCDEFFTTSWEAQQHHENVHKDQTLLQSGTKRNWDAMGGAVTGNDAKRVEVSDGAYKYTCRYCSMKFQLLPELGRHHQAAHKDQQDGRGSTPRGSTKQDESGGDSHGGAEKDGNVKKWRYRARTKIKTGTRGRPVPMKKQSGGAEAILLRMRAVKQVLGDQKTKRPPRKRDRKAERARRLAKLAVAQGATPAPMAARLKCRFCGLDFAAVLDLTKHHQAEHSAVKQAFIINGRGECQTGIYTLTKDGIIGPLQGELLNRTPNSYELFEVARATCCKEWFFNELGKRFAILPQRLFVQAAHLCSEAKLEVRWHQHNYVCPDGCKAYSPPPRIPHLGVDLSAFVKSSSSAPAGDAKSLEVGTPPLFSSSKSVISKSVLLSEDISNGMEKVPIRCVMDGDAMEPCSCSLCSDGGESTSPRDGQPWNNFVYINKRHLDPSLGLDTKSSQVGCSCSEEKCSASTCDHVSMFDTDNAEACSIDGNSIRGRFPYDEFGRIILDVGYMVYECNSRCHCKDSCQNRVLQKGVHLKLEVFKSRHKGWGVRAAEAIPRGTFVCEYVGEVLNDSEANQRGERYDQVGCSYLYNIDAHLDVIGARSVTKPFVIDATRFGNVARFINHSCEPNLINYEVLVESMDCQLAHIGFFAKRDIAIGEELAYDYRYKLLPGKGCPCQCGATNCRGRLY